MLAFVEGYARNQHLDVRQGSAIALGGRQIQSHTAGRQDMTGEWGVAYLPRGLMETHTGFQTPWGPCDYDWDGRTVLILGDSVTRQASEGPNTHLGTWPLQIALPNDVQLCVLAEDGYHPAEYAAMIQYVQARGLVPDLTLIVLCENDLLDRPARYSVYLNGTLALYEPPSHTLAWGPAWQPWLYGHSEAFRFAHWQLAIADPDRAVRIPVSVPSMQVVSALQSLQAAGPTQIWYLPLLQLQEDPHSVARLNALSQEIPGIDVLDRSGDPHGLRRRADDPIHLNDAGHAWITAQMQPVIDAALK